MIDLRSDTVTKPGKKMLEAMMNAKVGDDVYKEDPTVNALEEKIASIFKMQAALFCPSGTMANQIAINVHMIRFVTHIDFTDSMLEEVVKIIKTL